MSVRLIALVLFTTMYFSSQAQLKKAELDYINQQVLFINESIHGALILHRVYESYNQEVNQYVDLPSYSLNQYDNSDLPIDVFEDHTKWFYDIPPNTLYTQLSKNTYKGRVLPGGEINVSTIKNLCGYLNKDRISLENLLKTQDLNKLNVLQSFYASMEAVVEFYDQFQYHVINYEKELMRVAFNNNLTSDRKQVYTALLEIHLDIKKTIRQIGKENENGVVNSLTKINKERGWLMTCIKQLESDNEKKEILKIYEAIDATVSLIHNFVNVGFVPSEYALYGKGYYYQNVQLLTKTNRYGNGYVSELNAFFNRNKWQAVHFVEEPHFLKLIYPKLTPKEILTELTTPDLTISELRSKVKTPELPKKSIETQPETPEKVILTESPERPDIPLKIVGTHTLYVDSLSFTIEIYDHLIKDGDRVSINVNGEWLFTDISLEKEPQKIKLSISPDKENYILIQAVNVGWRPPNTVGVRYYSNGKVENILLKTDLKSTELLEIKYRKN